jgi:transposase
MSVGEDPRSGRPSTSTNDDHVERVRAVIRENRLLTVREVADEVGISIGSCHQIFIEKLQMRRVSAKFVPRLLTDVAPHPPYSPDLAPADFFLFPKLKTTLKGRRFQAIEEIQENAIRELRAITESAFQETFQQWKKRWEWCIASRGDNFEGDSAYNAVK